MLPISMAAIPSTKEIHVASQSFKQDLGSPDPGIFPLCSFSVHLSANIGILLV
ncbi:MAG: hypothetical protein L0I94_10630 [Yaniella sp.]|uniref:hypothetical protein n=1 Tax=Yaniella sp. TaxID=2773929 RepID=UPI002648B15F|nr:hypothetical protein [Yaniella sp.]MDN6149266.1 hypothetical protein [Yaniella sp.]MDN6173172.1 hypothetical protein [Yaniella sp.]